MGISGFFGTFVLPSLGNSIWWLELPTYYETKTIRSNDGRYYSATSHLQRIQQYDPDGNFEMGWFVDAGGGTFLIGFTEDGAVASASARKDHLEVFSPDG